MVRFREGICSGCAHRRSYERNDQKRIELVIAAEEHEQVKAIAKAKGRTASDLYRDFVTWGIMNETNQSER